MTITLKLSPIFHHVTHHHDHRHTLYLLSTQAGHQSREVADPQRSGHLQHVRTCAVDLLLLLRRQRGCGTLLQLRTFGLILGIYGSSVDEWVGEWMCGWVGGSKIATKKNDEG
jgi:hypothetical protein